MLTQDPAPRRRLIHQPVLAALVDGLLVVVPIGAVVLLVLGILHTLRNAAEPLSGTFVHPMVMGILLFVASCW